MKNVYLLLFTCFFLHACGQDTVNNPSPERLTKITEIEARVAQINDTLSLTKFITHTDTMDSHRVTFCVWIGGEGICKIRRLYSLKGVYKIDEYYYDWNWVLLKTTDVVLFDFSKKPHEQYLYLTSNTNLDDIDFKTAYYQFDEYYNKSFTIHNGDTIYTAETHLDDSKQVLKKVYHLQNQNPFRNLVYTHVVAYDFEVEHGEGIIIEDNKLYPTARNPRELSQEQVNNFIATITDTTTYGAPNAACFEPRMGIVFYNQNQVAAHISICFECNSLYSTIYLPAENYGFRGFSPAGRIRLKELCGSLGLTLCPAKDTMWDNPDKETGEE